MLCRVLFWGWLLLTAAACDSGSKYIGVGDVVSVDGDEVTIRHDRIDGLMDPATTRFVLSGEAAQAAPTPGVRVRFELRRRGAGLELTRISALAAGNPGIHDHTPHHGGVVAMVGMIHLEAKASANGHLLVYLTDVWRRPLPLGDVRGTVTLDLPQGKQVVPLTVGAEALEADGPSLSGATVDAAVALQRAGEPVDVNFVLPLDSAEGGAAGVPRAGCPAFAGTAGVASEPRCTLVFAKPIVALATAPDAATFLAAQVDLGVSAWRLPGVFVLGFAPPPPVVLPVPEPLHPEAPNAVLVRPDGREAVVALENRLIRYSTNSGALVRALDGPGGVVRAAAWTPDGRALLVSAFYDPVASLIDADDGHVRGRFAVEREGAAVALSADGRTAAVGCEAGPVTLFDVASSKPLRTFTEPRGPVRALAFLGARLLAAGDDGVLRVWDSGTGALQLERRLASTLRQMAVRGDGRVVAVAGIDPRIDIAAVADGAAVRPALPAGAQVTALAWVGTTLVSGDSEGRLAFWEGAGDPRQ